MHLARIERPRHLCADDGDDQKRCGRHMEHAASLTFTKRHKTAIELVGVNGKPQVSSCRPHVHPWHSMPLAVTSRTSCPALRETDAQVIQSRSTRSLVFILSLWTSVKIAIKHLYRSTMSVLPSFVIARCSINSFKCMVMQTLLNTDIPTV